MISPFFLRALLIPHQYAAEFIHYADWKHLVIPRSCILHSEYLDCRGGIYSSLKSEPEGFGIRFAIAPVIKEAV